jgi:hypothetical protein
METALRLGGSVYCRFPDHLSGDLKPRTIRTITINNELRFAAFPPNSYSFSSDNIDFKALVRRNRYQNLTLEEPE